MGIIEKQGIKSSIFMTIGFVIGALNLLVLFPLFFTKDDQGLVRALIDIGAILSVFCSLGTLPVIYKFFPFYNHYLGPKNNELPFLTLIINLIGFVLLLWIGWLNKNFIISNLAKSPSLVKYFKYIYPYTFFLMIFYWLEAFAWGLHKGVLTNFLRETAVRILTTLLILLLGFNWLNIDQFILFFSLIYVIPTLLLIYNLSKSNRWSFGSFKISIVTKRLKWKLLNFALFIFAGQFFNLLARTNDTIMIVTLRNLSDAGIFAIATYIAAIMEIPQRSLTSICIPVLSQSWKDKDIANIKYIYHKSVSNLLTIGLLLFGLIWLNIENLVTFLNWVSVKKNGGYNELVPIFFIMGLAKLIDLATGVNGQIIGTSKYWKFDFFTNLFYIVLSLRLNFYLIHHYQLIGLAYSNLAALTLFNSVRFLFLYKKFNLQPYTTKHGLFLIISIALMFLIYIIPSTSNFVLNIAIKSSIYGLGFYALIIWLNPAPELKDLVQGFLNKKLL